MSQQDEHENIEKENTKPPSVSVSEIIAKAAGKAKEMTVDKQEENRKWQEYCEREWKKVQQHGNDIY